MIKRTCPTCGAVMRRYGTGITARRHGVRWICPVAEAEVVADAQGHLHRVAGAKHTTTRVWTDLEVDQETNP